MYTATALRPAKHICSVQGSSKKSIFALLKEYWKENGMIICAGLLAANGNNVYSILRDMHNCSE